LRWINATARASLFDYQRAAESRRSGTALAERRPSASLRPGPPPPLSQKASRSVFVFDRNYVAFQALLDSCHSALWFAGAYREFREIFWLPMLSAKRLRKVLSYAPTTGIFRWKVSASSRSPVGAIAGAKNGRGYHQIRIGGRPYSASRLAWLYMTGKWPNSEISYINGKPSDTRWANLREAPSSQRRRRPKRK
jgi:hypothetical protein